MNRIDGNALLGAPAWTRRPVYVHVVAGKRDVSFFEKRNRVGIVAGNLSRPWSRCRAALPAADVQKNDVARTNLHARLLFPRLEIRACDRCARLDPIHAFQLRHVVEHAARDDTTGPRHDVPLLAAGFRRGVALHRIAVVHLVVHEEMTEGVGMRERQAVVTHLIRVGGIGRTNGVRRPVKDLRRAHVGRLLLRNRMRKRHDDAALHELCSALDFGRRDQIGRALLICRAPAAPVTQLGAPAQIVLRRHGRGNGLLRLLLRDNGGSGEHQANTKQRDTMSHRSLHEKRATV